MCMVQTSLWNCRKMTRQYHFYFLVNVSITITFCTFEISCHFWGYSGNAVAIFVVMKRRGSSTGPPSAAFLFLPLVASNSTSSTSVNSAPWAYAVSLTPVSPTCSPSSSARYTILWAKFARFSLFFETFAYVYGLRAQCLPKSTHKNFANFFECFRNVYHGLANVTEFPELV